MTYSRLLSIFFILPALGSLAQTAYADSSPNSVITVTSKDGTRIAAECAGAGPSLVIVHGGTGDRSRWTPLFPLLSSRFNVCAMDRRGHGDSQSGANYSLQKEFEDVVAVVNSRPGPVFVLGHSYGGLCALEAAFRTKKITKLILYEPPLQDLDHTAIADRMEKMIRAGDREQALTVFLREIVMISPDEIAAMKARASWPRRVAGIDTQIREIRALSKYRFDARRIATMKVPTLLLTGSKTPSPQLKQAISGLMDALPNRSLVVFEGQEHNAMDNVPQEFADTVTSFLLGKQGANSETLRNQHKNEIVGLTPPDVRWFTPPYYTDGRQRAQMLGDSSHGGTWIDRVKIPAGGRVRAHTHPQDEIVTVIAGTWYLGEGGRFDQSKLKPYPAGSFIVIPAGVPHFVAAKDGAVIVQLSGTGKFETEYLEK